jgi:hypothetical protein
MGNIDCPNKAYWDLEKLLESEDVSKPMGQRPKLWATVKTLLWPAYIARRGDDVPRVCRSYELHDG